eukprot:4381931-Amphidinium_carterae.2
MDPCPAPLWGVLGLDTSTIMVPLPSGKYHIYQVLRCQSACQPTEGVEAGAHNAVLLQHLANANGERPRGASPLVLVVHVMITD